MTTSTDDRREILDHIRSIFDAYLRHDRATIAATHTPDWRGFPVTARELVRGRERYLQQAEAVLQGLPAVRYEFLDVDVQVLGDHALVFYLARDVLAGEHGGITVLLRSLDVYRREADGWNQCGSSISALPETLQPPADPRQPGATVRGQVLAARAELWRARFDGPEQLAPLLADEVTAWQGPPGAAPLDKAAILAQCRAQRDAGWRLVDLQFPGTTFLAHGSVVVLASTWQLDLARDGAVEQQRGRGTEVFVYRGGRWWNTAWHLETAPAGQ